MGVKPRVTDCDGVACDDGDPVGVRDGVGCSDGVPVPVRDVVMVSVELDVDRCDGVWERDGVTVPLGDRLGERVVVGDAVPDRVCVRVADWVWVSDIAGTGTVSTRNT